MTSTHVSTVFFITYSSKTSTNFASLTNAIEYTAKCLATEIVWGIEEPGSNNIPHYHLLAKIKIETTNNIIKALIPVLATEHLNSVKAVSDSDRAINGKMRYILKTGVKAYAATPAAAPYWAAHANTEYLEPILVTDLNISPNKQTSAQTNKQTSA